MGKTDDFTYCAGWSDEVKDLFWERRRLVLRMENLENALKEVNPDDFETLFKEYRETAEKVQSAAIEFWRAQAEWNEKNNPLRQ